MNGNKKTSPMTWVVVGACCVLFATGYWFFALLLGASYLTWRKRVAISDFLREKRKLDESVANLTKAADKLKRKTGV